MNILITGGCGFVGSLIAVRAVARGDTVTLFDLAQPPDGLGGLDGKVAVVTGDIADRSLVADLPINPGASFSPNAAATCPKCSRLTWKMCFKSDGNVAYARTCDRNASFASVASSLSPPTAP